MALEVSKGSCKLKEVLPVLVMACRCNRVHLVGHVPHSHSGGVLYSNDGSMAVEALVDSTVHGSSCLGEQAEYC